MGLPLKVSSISYSQINYSRSIYKPRGDRIKTKNFSDLESFEASERRSLDHSIHLDPSPWQISSYKQCTSQAFLFFKSTKAARYTSDKLFKWLPPSLLISRECICIYPSSSVPRPQDLTILQFERYKRFHKIF